MKEVAIDDAVDTFDELTEDALRGHPAIKTREGRKDAVLISYEDWRRLEIRTRRIGGAPEDLTDGKTS